MRALHIASFNGNVGDQANHVGFWNLFKKYVTEDVAVENIDMREFYQSWNLRKFDNDFADYANTFDFVVFGGGSFFEVKWDYSSNGTTIDLPTEVFRRIKVPVIFNGLGFAVYQTPGVRENIINFDSFLRCLVDNEKCVVSVRNDGSRSEMMRCLSPSAVQKVFGIPDGGFFTQARDYYHPEIPSGKKVIAINIAKDMEAKRWDGEFTYQDFVKEFANFVNICISRNPEYHFVFIPHIPSDISAISDVLKYVNDANCRMKISTAPCLNGTITPSDYIVDLYRKCDLAIGMRYHSNICAIAMNTPTISIVTLNAHVSMYQDIQLSDRHISVNKGPFADTLCKKVEEMLCAEKRPSTEALIEELEKRSLPYYNKIRAILADELKPIL